MIPTQKSEFICPDCGSINVIQRKTYKKKKLYHIKDLYCHGCKKVTKQIELHDVNLFKLNLEFKEKLTEKEKYILDLINKNNNSKLKEENERNRIFKKVL